MDLALSAASFFARTASRLDIDVCARFLKAPLLPNSNLFQMIVGTRLPLEGSRPNLKGKTNTLRRLGSLRAGGAQIRMGVPSLSAVHPRLLRRACCHWAFEAHILAIPPLALAMPPAWGIWMRILFIWACAWPCR